MNSSNTIPNYSLHNKQECPFCHFVFVTGFDDNNYKKCPSCSTTYQKNLQINHGPGCSICTGRHRGSNNVYHNNGCPAIMSDGRFITNYNSSNELTESMRKLNGITNPNEFRNFMQKNGELFMDAERNHIVKENTCRPKTACSEGWYNLWTKNNGDWSNLDPHKQ
ncbi:hypothetical protein [Bandra megavirus]|uniref:Zn-finger domain-containing protein n=1 Tax=Bandra megavirus TaxID=2071566 RepID=A0A2K9V803_9VIRU|nr:hypothetical protein [Bandra megavirus]